MRQIKQDYSLNFHVVVWPTHSVQSQDVALINSSLTIPQEKLIKGRWDVNMEWQYENKKYLTKEVIYVN